MASQIVVTCFIEVEILLFLLNWKYP